jgi:Fe-S cluster assembly ATP-binding protein
VREARGEAPLDAFDFLSGAARRQKPSGLPEAMLGRPSTKASPAASASATSCCNWPCCKPRLALLDEIDSGLDVDGVRAVVALVQRCAPEGTAFIVVSHYLQMIESLAARQVLRWTRAASPRPATWSWRARIARTGFRAQACGRGD